MDSDCACPPAISLSGPYSDYGKRNRETPSLRPCSGERSTAAHNRTPARGCPGILLREQAQSEKSIIYLGKRPIN
jgi:hypothetical protein